MKEGRNLYAYCSGNPVTMFDSNGQEDEYCFTPGCGELAPGSFLKDALFGAGEGLYDTGKGVKEGIEDLEEDGHNLAKRAIENPEEVLGDFAKIINEGGPGMLFFKGLKQQGIHLYEQYTQFEDAVDQGKVRSASRILTRNASAIGLQVLASEVLGAVWFSGRPLIPGFRGKAVGRGKMRGAPATGPSSVRTPAAAPQPSPVTTAPARPRVLPQMRIRYTQAMSVSPSDAQFLRFNVEWALRGRGFLTLGTRNAADAGLRSWARRWMDRSQLSRAGRQAMHPLDSAINPWVQTGTPGRTYYFGNESVNLSFGGQIGSEIKRLNLRLGDDFTVDFADFPSYDLVRPTAPPGSPPNRMR